MAASLADDIHRGWATAGLYGLATAVAVSRVYDREHWLSDVAGGAAVGITAAKLARGRWRVFGIRPPTFLVGARGAGLGWQFALRE
jgi:membrane-associated phospholipid phosphatase